MHMSAILPMHSTKTARAHTLKLGTLFKPCLTGYSESGTHMLDVMPESSAALGMAFLEID